MESLLSSPISFYGLLLRRNCRTRAFRPAFLKPLEEERSITDLNQREVLIFAPLIVGTLVLGFAPGMVFEVTSAATQSLVGAYHAATGR